MAAISAGLGDPVVFLHAGLGDSRMWRIQMRGISATHQVIAYDRRGFGRTPAAGEPFSHVRDLMTVLDAVAGERAAVLVGASRGGRIALDAALLHPSRLRGLFLLAPAIGGAPPGASSPRADALVMTIDEAEAAGDLAQVNALEARLWLDGPDATAIRVKGAARRLFLDMNGKALACADPAPCLDPADAFTRLRDITTPTCVVWGALDLPQVQERCRHLVDVLGASSHVLAGAAHLPNLEEPKLVTALLTSFLKQLAVSAPERP